MLIFSSNSTSNSTAKKEGTTQTYGQLITLVSKADVGTSTTREGQSSGQSQAVSPRDTIVRIVPNDPGAGVSLSNTDRSKIAISAFSDTKEPTVALAKDSILREQKLEGSQLNNISDVMQNTLEHAIVLGSSVKSREDIKRALTEAQKVDMMITLKSKESEELEFNNLKEIDPDIDFTYNFFINDEENTESQEDQATDPLLKKDLFNVPRYVKLSWTPISVTEKLTETETTPPPPEVKQLKEIFILPQGATGFSSTNFKDSYEKSKKDTAPYIRDGISLQVTDIHKLDLAIDSTSNKKIFTNSVNATFNIKESKNVISSLPILKVLKK